MQDFPIQWVILGFAVVLLVLGGWWWSRRARRGRLQSLFGPEYQHVVEKFGDRAKAEDELEKRRQRVKRLDIVALPEEERRRFATQWQAVQSRFVDQPRAAVSEAHSLVTAVMKARGYPTEDLAQRRADLSVEVPEVVGDYRQARAIAERNRRGEASTEDLRQAMVHYRALFEALLVAGETSDTSEPRRRHAL